MLVRRSIFKPLYAAIAALAAVLLLGGTGPAVNGIAPLLSWGLLGLALAGGTGFLAWHLAQLTTLPLRPGGHARAALPAALVPLIAIPGIGAAALLVPAVLALALLRRERFAALAALAGIGAAIGPGPFAAGVAGATMLVAAWFARARCPAANDNPSMERALPFWPVPNAGEYGRKYVGIRFPNLGSGVNVQRQ